MSRNDWLALAVGGVNILLLLSFIAVFSGDIVQGVFSTFDAWAYVTLFSFFVGMIGIIGNCNRLVAEVLNSEATTQHSLHKLGLGTLFVLAAFIVYSVALKFYLFNSYFYG